MKYSIFLFLLVPTVVQPAAHSSTQPSTAERMKSATEEERSKIMNELEQKRQAYLKAKEYESEQKELKQEQREKKSSASVAGETKRTHEVAGRTEAPAAQPTKKQPVQSLQDIAAQRLYKEWSAQAEKIANVWINAEPHDDFTELLKRSYVLSPIPPKTPNVVTLPLLRLLFDNQKIAELISTLPLFTRIGTWPENIKSALFNKHGYVIGVNDHTTYLFNYLSPAMKTIPHESTDIVTHSFSYDGSILAIKKERTGGAEENYETILYNTTSGEIVYVANNTNDFQFSTTSPLCCYFDGTDTIVYNYRLKTTLSHSAAASGESILKNDTIISPDCSFIAFVIEETHKLYLQDTTTGYRFYVEDITDLVGQMTRFQSYVDFITFNSTGSLLSVADPRNATIKLFNTRELSKSAQHQKPFIEISGYGHAPYAPKNRLFLSWLDVHFSADGKQLLFPTKDNTYTIYDLTQQKSIETVTLPLNSPAKYDTVSSFSENMLRYVVYTNNIPHDELFLRKTHQTVFLGDTLWLNIDTTTQKVAYENQDGIYLLDTTTLLKSTLVTSSQRSSLETSLLGSSKGFFNSQGTLLYAHDTAIEQLMIDPSSCSLDQIFFLLGLAHAQRDGGDTANNYQQLLTSPILATFSLATRTYITTLLQECLKSSKSPTNKTATGTTAL